MAKIAAKEVQIKFEDDSSIKLSMDDENSVVVLEQGERIIWIPRDELEQFASILVQWSFDHPVAA